MSEENKKGFVIKDARRFDQAGEERPIDSVNESSDDSGKGSSLQSSGQTGAKASRSESVTSNLNSQTGKVFGDSLAELNFSQFVISLATQTLMQLGDIKPPPDIEVQVDLQAAKQTIDILSLLKEKTKGNLSKDEEHLLEEILHNLRLSFVRNSSN
ncbi:MAG TPA: DUF1844 domain-containing protein [Oligoflexia bacterium]|nr:DUF1844 domain-containing protein [Oligoflexia bacterium]HMP26637.1 DUF1844 domain-containing protein [Oligoflexia bacterium]